MSGKGGGIGKHSNDSNDGTEDNGGKGMSLGHTHDFKPVRPNIVEETNKARCDWLF